ncbi:lipid A-modifier LpxR family protein [Roseococcus sp.]|uniref:lipid A-modifier LpxR family protein n=1 Tax=Roseococcus sp. TaxID=2109646 RepID=UPI003BAACE26
MSDLLVIAFPTEAQAEEVRTKVLGLQREYLIELGDAVVAVKGADGQVKLNQLFQPVAAGAASGALWGSLIGLVLLMPLVGAAIGAASGALGGKLTDLGINDNFMKETAKSLEARPCRALPADPQDDDGQGDGRARGHGRHHPAQLLRRDEGRGPARGPGRRPGRRGEVLRDLIGEVLRMRAALIVLLGMVVALPALAQTTRGEPVRVDQAADPRGTFSLMVDNDLFAGTDKNYTSGFQLDWRSPSYDPPRWLSFLTDRRSLIFPEGGTPRWGISFGQNVFTPSDTMRTTPDPKDRPYAAFLFGSISLASYTATSYGSMELQMGIVGPGAWGRQAQNGVHRR